MKDSQSGEPLRYAHVALEGIPFGTITNEEGKCRLILTRLRHKKGKLWITRRDVGTTFGDKVK